MEDVCYTSAIELRALLEKRAISAAEVVTTVLDRVSDVNSELNAIISLRGDAALGEAKAVDSALRSSRSLLAGIPITVKDLTETLGLPTTCGSRPLEGFQTGFDAEIVARLKRAGAIIIGKTNTPEFGLRPTTENLLYGTTLNPWNLKHNPGGSSGGSAAAVAAGMAPLSQGTDGGGSIRNPASCCRLVGLKPTRGRVPSAPALYEVWAGLSTDGPLARTVRDTALLLDVIAGPVIGEPYGLPRDSSTFVAACDRRLGPQRIAYTFIPPHGQVDAEIVEVVLGAAKAFESMGHHVSEASPDLSGQRDAFKTIIAANAPTLIDSIDPVRLPMLEPSTLSLLLYAGTVSAPAYCRAVNHVRGRGAQVMRFWEEYDFLLTPVMTKLPPVIGQFPSAYDVETIWSEISDLGAFTYPFNLSGQPAISLPAGWSRNERLPIGIQLVGRYGGEADLFSLAAEYEEARPWAADRPRVGSGTRTTPIQTNVT